MFTRITPPARQRLSDAIVAEIEQRIVDGGLKPGDCLPSERELAEQLEVSRPSVREALLKLEARGLVQPRRGGGVQVIDVFAPTFTEPLVRLLKEQPQTAYDVLELRHALEEVAAYYAALRATPEDLERLTARFNALSKGEGDVAAAAQHDAEFHLSIAEASHNLALVYTMRGLFQLLRSSIWQALDRLYREEGAYDVIYTQHQALYDAIVARDAEAARQAASLHLNYIGASWRQIEPTFAEALEAAPIVRRRGRGKIAAGR